MNKSSSACASIQAASASEGSGFVALLIDSAGEKTQAVVGTE
jgi:hypothetical protein